MKGKLQGDGEEGPLLKPGCVLSVCGSEGGQPGIRAHETRTPRSWFQRESLEGAFPALENGTGTLHFNMSTSRPAFAVWFVGIHKAASAACSSPGA